MRILHLNDRLSGRGGADIHLHGVLSALVAEHEVLLAVGREDGAVEVACRVEQLAGLDAAGAQPVALDRLFARFSPDVVHIHNVVNPVVLRWAADRPALVTVQDHRSFCPGRGKLTAAGGVCDEPLDRVRCRDCFARDADDYYQRILSLTRERLAALRRLPAVVLSRYMRAQLLQVGLEPSRVHVIPPFVHDLPRPPAEQPQREPADACLLFVGRLVAAKGVFDALAAHRRSGLSLPLLFAGTGSARAALEREGARVLGWVDRGRLAALLRRASVVVMPSRWQEPFGIVGLEALACGTPVAAYRSGGIPEWHPGGPGLVDWGDVDQLAAALAVLADGRAQPASGFEREALMAQLVGLYRHVAGRVALSVEGP